MTRQDFDSALQRLLGYLFDAEELGGYAGTYVHEAQRRVDLYWKGPQPPSLTALLGEVRNACPTTVMPAPFDVPELRRARDRIAAAPGCWDSGIVTMSLAHDGFAWCSGTTRLSLRRSSWSSLRSTCRSSGNAAPRRKHRCSPTDRHRAPPHRCSPGTVQKRRYEQSRAGSSVRRMGDREEHPRLREFVGFVWQDAFEDRTGVLVEAVDASEAASVVRAAFGSAFRVSVWNEEDAAKPR